MEQHLYDTFAKLEDTHWWFRGRRAIAKAVLQRYLPPATKTQILDVGCGTGGMLPMLRELGDVEGLEMSPTAIAHCRHKLQDVVVHEGGLPEGIPNRKYGLITAFDVLEHLDDPVAALRRIADALEAPGLFVCTVPAFPFLWSAHDDANQHRRRYLAALLKSQLAEAGFRVQYLSHFNTWLFPPVAGVRLMQRFLKPAASREGASHETDLHDVHPWVNRILTEVFSSERLAVPRFRLPVGLSLIAVAQLSAQEPR